MLSSQCEFVTKGQAFLRTNSNRSLIDSIEEAGLGIWYRELEWV
jgi:hypothetical protein